MGSNGIWEFENLVFVDTGIIDLESDSEWLVHSKYYILCLLETIVNIINCGAEEGMNRREITQKSKAIFERFPAFLIL